MSEIAKVFSSSTSRTNDFNSNSVISVKSKVALRTWPQCCFLQLEVSTSPTALVKASSSAVHLPRRRATATLGAVAMVLASEEWIAEKNSQNTAWIHGMGWATETAFLGDRDLSHVTSLQAAAKQAYAEAGITEPRQAFEVAEVADATGYQEDRKSVV